MGGEFEDRDRREPGTKRSKKVFIRPAKWRPLTTPEGQAQLEAMVDALRETLKDDDDA